MTRLFFLLGCFQIFSIALKAQAEYIFRVDLRDKQGTQYSLSQPSAYLSQRAIQRRQRQSITIDSTDLPISQVYVDSILTYPNCAQYGQSRWTNALYLLTSDSSQMLQIASLDFVKGIRKVGYYPFGFLARPEKEKDKVETALDKNYSYGPSNTQINIHNGALLHQNNYTGSGSLIALMDAGYDGVDQVAAFDSLRLQGRILLTKNFLHPTESVYQYSGHGTEVLSIMAANIPNSIVGTAPDAEYALLVTEDLGSEQETEIENIVMAAEFADSLGTDVINISLGYTDMTYIGMGYSKSQLDGQTCPASRALTMASRKGIMVFKSAGNEGNNSWGLISFPSDADSTLTVGNVNANGQRHANSSKGPTVDGRIKPDIMSMGTAVVSINKFGNVVTNTGSSLASPVIAGLTACLLKVDTTLDWRQYRQLLLWSSSRYLNPDFEYGYGVPNFQYILDSILSVKSTDHQLDKISVFPNPSQGQVQLQFPDPLKGKSMEIRVFGMDGKSIKSSIIHIHGNYYWQHGLSRGLYLLEFSSEGHSYYRLLEVQDP